MPRDISDALFTALTGPNPRPFRAVEIFFPSMTLRLWTGINIRTLNGDDYIGAGSILSFGEVEETANIEAAGTSITLSGIDPAMIAIALDEPYQGSVVKLYLGEKTAANQMIEIGTGIVNTMEISDTPETTTITVTIENILIDLLRPRVSRYTHEEQQLLYPDDLGFEFVAKIQDMQLIV
jgi:hypothetical protein